MINKTNTSESESHVPTDQRVHTFMSNRFPFFLPVILTAHPSFCRSSSSSSLPICRSRASSFIDTTLNKAMEVTVLSLLLMPLLWTCVSGLEKDTYIVYMAKSQMPMEFTEHGQWYGASLSAVSEMAEILYTYDTVAHGFSARLTKSEAEALLSREGIVEVRRELKYDLHTTRTPEFLGLSAVPGWANMEVTTASSVVVGVLDTGAWPDSKSYDDTGFGPVPTSWKGTCEEGTGFSAGNCNRKLIGARYFSKGFEAAMGSINTSKESKSPRDDDGHGTHTSTTAAGSLVSNASLFGFAEGVARGMAPKARIAVYKVCWVGGCFGSDILAALDKAVDDGVDVLSLSLGGGQSDYFRDTVAIGSFAAMEKGIFVSCSAGNAGPTSSSLSNVAPWIATVGAGSLDRDFPAYVVLGNGKNFTGASTYNGKQLPENTKLSIIYAGNATNFTNGNLCLPGTLIPEKVKGKIVFCDRGISARAQKGYVVKEAGGVGLVLANGPVNGEELVTDSHLLPAAGVGEKAGDEIRSYILTDPNPTATIISGGTKVGIKPSPEVTAFSSRGPNGITPEVLKPDMIAPGLNILAGWSGAVGPTGLPVDARRVEFNIISGTSMSCPHVSGLAALLKSAHPEWSPAAIKSALMTTAYNSYTSESTTAGAFGLLDVATDAVATPFAIGAGHVDPVRASDPGLVYDLTTDDYLNFLCALNYTSLQLSALSRRNYTCDSKKAYSVRDLNYPSFAVPFETASGAGGGGNGVTTLKYTRTLTNVGGGPATYRVTASSPSDVKVVVDPAVLSFGRQGEKLSYTVSFSAASQPSGSESFGRLVWTDGKHVVGSPVAYTWT